MSIPKISGAIQTIRTIGAAAQRFVPAAIDTVRRVIAPTVTRETARFSPARQYSPAGQFSPAITREAVRMAPTIARVSPTVALPIAAAITPRREATFSPVGGIAPAGTFAPARQGVTSIPIAPAQRSGITATPTQIRNPMPIPGQGGGFAATVPGFAAPSIRPISLTGMGMGIPFAPTALTTPQFAGAFTRPGLFTTPDGFPIINQEEEEERRRRQQLAQAEVPGVPPPPVPPEGMTLEAQQRAQQQAQQQAIEAQRPQLQGFPRPLIPPAVQPAPFTMRLPEGELQAADIQEGIGQISKMIQTGGATASTMLEAQAWLASTAERLKMLRDAQEPTPAEPVQETWEQFQELLRQPEGHQAAFKSQADQMRLEVGLPVLETQRIDLMKQLAAANDAFAQIIKSIQENPELPKGLAQKRIQLFVKQNELMIRNLMGQLEITGAQIDQANAQLNFRLGIARDDRAEEERRRDRAQQMLNMLVNSGGISQATNEDLSRIARNLGWDQESINSILGSLQKVRSIKNKELTTDEYSNVAWRTDEATGNITAIGIDKKTNKPVTLGTIQGIARPVIATPDMRFRTIERGGRRIEQALDKDTGRVIREDDLGPVGVSAPEAKRDFLSTLGRENRPMTRDELEAMARTVGLEPTIDKDIIAAIDAYVRRVGTGQPGTLSRIWQFFWGSPQPPPMTHP